MILKKWLNLAFDYQILLWAGVAALWFIVTAPWWLTLYMLGVILIILFNK